MGEFSKVIVRISNLAKVINRMSPVFDGRDAVVLPQIRPRVLGIAQSLAIGFVETDTTIRAAVVKIPNRARINTQWSDNCGSIRPHVGAAAWTAQPSLEEVEGRHSQNSRTRCRNQVPRKVIQIRQIEDHVCKPQPHHNDQNSVEERARALPLLLDCRSSARSIWIDGGHGREVPNHQFRKQDKERSEDKTLIGARNVQERESLAYNRDSDTHPRDATELEIAVGRGHGQRWYLKAIGGAS